MDNLNKTHGKINRHNKVMDVLKNKKVFINRLEKRYNADLKEFSDTIESNRLSLVGEYLGVENPKREDVVKFVKTFDPSGEHEDSSWEAGYLRGIETSISELKHMGDKNNDKTKIHIPEDMIKNETIDNVKEKIDIRKIAEKYTEKYLNKELSDLETAYNFLNHINEETYFGEGKEISLVWNHDGHRDIPGEEGLAFDVFYNHTVKDREYNVSVEFIEWINETKNKKVIINELISTTQRIEEHISFLDNNQSKIDNVSEVPGMLREIENDHDMEEGELDRYFINS